MKSSIAVVALLASLALAGPIKRVIVTEWEIETVTKTVTVIASANKPATGWGSVGIKTSKTSSIQFVQTKPSSTSAAQATQVKPSPSTTTAAQPVNTKLSSATTAVAATSTPSTSGQSANTGNSNLSSYAAAVLEQHNVHRYNHSVPGLVWDDYLTNVARQHAETCVYQHSRDFGDGDYGQNIGAGYPVDAVPKMVTNDMYNGEINHYPGYGREPDMGNFHVWGHFSQIVWKDTKSVGCYTAKCSSLKNVGGNVPPFFTVCNYKPSGNYGGQYSKNVLQPLNQKSVVIA